MARKPAEQTVHPDAIIRAAAAVFHQRGYHGATMADIARAVDLTAGSLYHHFPSKEHLLIAVLDAGLDQITREVHAAVSAAPDHAARLRALVAVHVRSVTANASIAAAVIFESRALLDIPAVRDEAAARRDALEAIYRGVIEDGMAAGAFRAVDAGVFVKTLFGALNWVSVWYRADGRLSADAIAAEIAATFERALAPPESGT